MLGSLTPTEQRIFDCLKDGEAHLVHEIKMLIDELASPTAVQMHISRLRSKLPSGVLILHEAKERRYWYRLVSRYSDQLA